MLAAIRTDGVDDGRFGGVASARYSKLIRRFSHSVPSRLFSKLIEG